MSTKLFTECLIVSRLIRCFRSASGVTVVICGQVNIESSEAILVYNCERLE